MNRKQIKRLKGLIRKISSQTLRNEVLKRDGFYCEGYDARGARRKNIRRFRCSDCGKTFAREEVEVDHIEEVGEFKIEGPVRNTKYGDCRVTNWQEWMDRLFCNLDNFQILCTSCHDAKTLDFNQGLRNTRRGWLEAGGNLL